MQVQALAMQDTRPDAIATVAFAVMSAGEIRKVSACQVTSACGQAVEGSLYDPRMGAVDYGSICSTCKHDNRRCPGHFGHIELAIPVFNSLFVPYVLKILRCVCLKCSAACLPVPFVCHLSGEARLRRACDESSHRVKECPLCGDARPDRIQWDKHHLSCLRYTSRVDSDEGILTSRDVYRILTGVSDQTCREIGLDPVTTRPESLMFKALPVTPTVVRPPHMRRRDDDLTHKMSDIIKSNAKVAAKVECGDDYGTFVNLVNNLQLDVIHLIENSGNGIPQARMRATNRPLKSIASRLKGKEGRVRSNLMGKRVDFSARSVITPEPNISIDELGVPIRIAMTLTFPEVVHDGNRHRLTIACQNGPDTYPGARLIRQAGIPISLERSQRRANIELRNGDVVERHMIDGDRVLFNRQPSLHRMSMMTHLVKVMPSDTFRLNVLVTECFNADFDGDEMNLHLPQSMSTQIEIARLGSVRTQVVSPRHHKPIIGVVQDVALGCYLLTSDDVAIDAKTVANIWARCGLDPDGSDGSVSGRALFSSILPRDLHCEVDESSIVHGDVVSGPIGKKQYQAQSDGVLHSVFREFGQDAAVNLLNRTQWMACDWLVSRGFSVGARDIMILNGSDEALVEIARRTRQNVDAILNSVHTKQFRNDTADSDIRHLECRIREVVTKAGDEACKIARRDGALKQSRLLSMVDAKSKGNDSNVRQMMGMLAQNYVEHERIPHSSDGRTLPHFKRFDDGADARGFVASSFRKGLRPHEFFFHAMAGREGLIDTAVKTADSGYIQRKLVKALEDLKVVEGGSVRSASNKIISFLYGGDGMDACMIEAQRIPTYACGDMAQMAAEFLITQQDDGEMKRLLTSQAYATWRSLGTIEMERLKDHWIKLIEDKSFVARVHHITPSIGLDVGDISHAIAFDRIITRLSRANNPSQFGSDLNIMSVLDAQEDLIANLYPESGSVVRLGAVLVRSCLSPKRLIRRGVVNSALKSIVATIKNRFYESLVATSEMVGILAAQSIAETSTQMVLNSFHQAGTHDEGGSLPRVKDLIHTSKNPKNTTYRVKLLSSMDESSDFATTVRNTILRTEVKDVTTCCSMLCEVEESVSEDDTRIERLRAKLTGPGSGETKGVDTEAPRFVLRLELNRFKMSDHGVTMLDVHREIVKSVYAHVSASDDASDALIIRVTPFLGRGTGSDVITELKELESRVLSVPIKGVQGVDSCIVQASRPGICAEFREDTSQFVERKHYTVVATSGTCAKRTDLFDIACIPGVDMTRTQTNNLCHVASIFGVEGARSLLMRELLASYSDDTFADFRHIELLVDYITHRGSLTAIARHGIDATDAGPLSKCSFEKTVPKIIQAGVFGEIDDVSGVSANIMLGQTAPCGTGSSTLLWDAASNGLPSGDVMGGSNTKPCFHIDTLTTFVLFPSKVDAIPAVDLEWTDLMKAL